MIKGLTTNPTLMRKAGISDYEQFARQVLQVVTEKPISFEVFSDDFPEMRRQALRIKSWQRNVFVKIPITNSRGDSSIPLIKDLATEGTQFNIFQADECGCHIVTVPHDILSKAAKLVGTNLDALSLDTVKMFAKDAELAGFNL